MSLESQIADLVSATNGHTQAALDLLAAINGNFLGANPSYTVGSTGDFATLEEAAAFVDGKVWGRMLTLNMQAETHVVTSSIVFFSLSAAIKITAESPVTIQMSGESGFGIWVHKSIAELENLSLEMTEDDFYGGFIANGNGAHVLCTGCSVNNVSVTAKAGVGYRAITNATLIASGCSTNNVGLGFYASGVSHVNADNAAATNCGVGYQSDGMSFLQAVATSGNNSGNDTDYGLVSGSVGNNNSYMIYT